MSRQLELRTGREAAIRALNAVAHDLGVKQISCRPVAGEVVKLWERVCKVATADHHDALETARAGWLEHNGGGALPESMLHGGVVDSNSDMVNNHRTLLATPAKGKKKKIGFRLQSKAFMLTYNSQTFQAGQAFWDGVLAWVKDRAATHGATEWSAALELSTQSSTAGRVHIHVYFSWLQHNAVGVDQKTTDEWVFRGTRPRVDVNCEVRGLHHWRKAAQRGHFYCSAHKEGALYSASNYPPWEGGWAPEVSWVTSLYRQHKLSHDALLLLSAKLRDGGHDRRKAAVEASRATEAAAAFAEEQAEARRLLLSKALPFKPLCPQIESWRMSFEEVEERYKMLVLHGPSRTGKSRLARSLFGLDRTLVVDVQHAEHPDLHGYRRHQHLAILLDEVASPKFIVGNKKLLQAHVDGALLGQSATQMFTYGVFLWRTPVILTTNNWDLSSLAGDELEWVSSNCVAVQVDTPVFEPTRKASALPKPRPSHKRQRALPKPLPKPRPSHKRQRVARELPTSD